MRFSDDDEDVEVEVDVVLLVVVDADVVDDVEVDDDVFVLALVDVLVEVLTVVDDDVLVVEVVVHETTWSKNRNLGFPLIMPRTLLLLEVSQRLVGGTPFGAKANPAQPTSLMHACLHAPQL